MSLLSDSLRFFFGKDLQFAVLGDNRNDIASRLCVNHNRHALCVLFAACSNPCCLLFVRSVSCWSCQVERTKPRQRSLCFCWRSALSSAPVSSFCEFDLSQLIGIVNYYLQNAKSAPTPPLSVVTVSGRSFLGPWTSLANFLRFDSAQSSKIRAAKASHFVQRDGFVGIDAEGLADACAEHGHSTHLLLLASEDSTYKCALRSFLRFLSEPSKDPDCQALSGVSSVFTSRQWFVDEAALLKLFGVKQNTQQAKAVRRRQFINLESRQLEVGAQKLTDNRIAVVALEDASSLFRALLANKLSHSCAIRSAVAAAASRLVFEARLAQSPAVDRRAELAACLCRLAAQVLAQVPMEECLSSSMVSDLTLLVSQLGAVLRLRNAQRASEAVKSAAAELALGSMAKFSNEQYIAARGEPVTVALLQSLLGCGRVRAERADNENVRNIFPGLENLAATERTERMRTAAVITCLDCAMKSTNSAFVSPRSYLVAQDMLTVSGERCSLCIDCATLFVVCTTGSSRVVNLLARLGLAAPTASALRKETKRFLRAYQTQQQTNGQKLSMLSVIDFRDNLEAFRRKACRARANKRTAPHQPRVVRFPAYVPADNPHSRAQFEFPLRTSPLPQVSLANFEPSAAGMGVYSQWQLQRMVQALAQILASPADIVRRQMTIRSSLHEDGIAAKVCDASGCSRRYSTLYKSTKRKCDVSPPTANVISVLFDLFSELQTFVGAVGQVGRPRRETDRGQIANAKVATAAAGAAASLQCAQSGYVLRVWFAMFTLTLQLRTGNCRVTASKQTAPPMIQNR